MNGTTVSLDGIAEPFKGVSKPCVGKGVVRSDQVRGSGNIGVKDYCQFSR